LRGNKIPIVCCTNYFINTGTLKRPSKDGTASRVTEPFYIALVSDFTAVFLAGRAGRVLPKLPSVILPRFVRLSPLPILKVV
jgi:hypothetical protein